MPSSRLRRPRLSQTTRQTRSVRSSHSEREELLGHRRKEQASATGKLCSFVWFARATLTDSGAILTACRADR